jgi:hypothetical protein
MTPRCYPVANVEGESRFSILNDSSEFFNINHALVNISAIMMRRVTSLRIKQKREYRLPAINGSRESTKNHEYLFVFEVKFKKPSYT